MQKAFFWNPHYLSSRNHISNISIFLYLCYIAQYIKIFRVFLHKHLLTCSSRTFDSIACSEVLQILHSVSYPKCYVQLLSLCSEEPWIQTYTQNNAVSNRTLRYNRYVTCNVPSTLLNSSTAINFHSSQSLISDQISWDPLAGSNLMPKFHCGPSRPKGVINIIYVICSLAALHFLRNCQLLSTTFPFFHTT